MDPTSFFASVQEYDKKKLLQLNYEPYSPKTEEEVGLCVDLMLQVKKVKNFFWDRFKFIGLNNKELIPPFFVKLKDENTYYLPKSMKNEVCFKFITDYDKHPEILAHEFTHAFVDSTNPLGNKGEAGAINESIADVIGVLFKQSCYDMKGWEIGENLRDLKKKTTYQEIKKLGVGEEPNKNNDQGYVHYNSQFLSHAFYQASKELEKSNADLGNHRLLCVWLKAVQSLKENEKTFEGFAEKTIEVGHEGFNLLLGMAIRKAWNEVGMKV